MRPRFYGFYGDFRVKVHVRHYRDGRKFNYLSERPGGFQRRNGDAHEFRSRIGESFYGGCRFRYVFGQGIRHRLHRDGCAASYLKSFYEYALFDFFHRYHDFRSFPSASGRSKPEDIDKYGKQQQHNKACGVNCRLHFFIYRLFEDPFDDAEHHAGAVQRRERQ